LEDCWVDLSLRADGLIDRSWSKHFALETDHLALIHAPGGGSGVWEKTAQQLSSARYRVVAIDVPPLGSSKRPVMPACSRVGQARWIIGTLDGLFVQRAVLLCHSFGGAVAEAALRWPSGRECCAQPYKPAASL
jgi:pimeloyl-ACP methyl ester carboxylesterase